MTLLSARLTSPFTDSSTRVSTNRRQLLTGAAATAGLAVGGGALAGEREPIDFQSPADNLRAWMKIYSDLDGNVDIYSWFSGHIFASVNPVSAMLPLLGFEGFAVNRCVPQGDGSFRVFINEVAFYKDIQTDRIIDSWLNPFTNERVEVFQLHAGPLTNQLTTVRKFELPDGSFAERPFVLPWLISGDDAFVSIEFNDVRDNPIQPDEWPRESVGEKIRVSESMQFMTKLSDLENPAVQRVNPTMGWTLLRSWLPWMLMGRAPGHLFYRNVVQKLSSMNELPRRLLDETERRFPEYLTSPPDESFGSFQTSYKIFKAEREPAPPLP